MCCISHGIPDNTSRGQCYHMHGAQWALNWILCLGSSLGVEVRSGTLALLLLTGSLGKVPGFLGLFS